MKRAWMFGAAVAILFSFGCETQKPEYVEDFSGLDQKSDQFSKKMKLLGSLDYGQTVSAAYHNPPKYRAFKFGGQKGDQVTIDVSSRNGDSVAWLVDNAFRILKKNDDYKGGFDSHIEATLPGNTNPDIITYYIVFTEFWGDDATFNVSLAKKQQFCGGFAGIQCPAGQQCVDNPNDSCDPNNGGADCGGICVAGCVDTVLCVRGSHWDSVKCQCVQDQQFCGGIAGIQCPAGFECVDNPNDGCDPARGGADCGGICVEAPPTDGCAAVRCAAGTQCVNCFGGPRCLGSGEVCAF